VETRLHVRHKRLQSQSSFSSSLESVGATFTEPSAEITPANLVERRPGGEEEARLKDAFDGLGLVGLSTGDGDQFLEGGAELFIVVGTLFKQASVCGYAVEADIVGGFQRVDRSEDIDGLDICVLGYYG
jgi:hypothetical protein